MEKLMQELQRKGLFPANGTLQEFVKQYGNKDALTSLHTDLVSKEILDESVADFDSFVTGFELSEVVNPTILGGDDPFRNEFAEDMTSTEQSPAAMAADKSENLEEWYQSAIASLTVNGQKVPNYEAQYKRIYAEYMGARLDNATVGYENLQFQKVVPYLNSETSNPMIDVKEASEVVSQDNAGRTFIPGGQAQLEDKYNRQNTDPEAGPQTGLHSWMFPEFNVNLKPFGAANSQGIKDSEYKLANKLWTISDEWDGSVDRTLIPVLERQYPGYKFDLSSKPGGQRPQEIKAVDGMANNVLGTEIEVTAPNGEKTTIYGGIKGRGLTNDTDIRKSVVDQKVKLANFINTNGISLNKVKYATQNTAQRYNDLLAKPYNEVDISQGGIGLDTKQQAQARTFGEGRYVENEDGKIDYNFVYNNTLFTTPREMMIQSIEQEFPGKYFKDVPDIITNISKYATQKVDKITKDPVTEGIKRYLEDTGKGYGGKNLGENQGDYGTFVPAGNLYNVDTPAWHKVRDENRFINSALQGGIPTNWELLDGTKAEEMQYGNQYSGPGTKIWKQTKASLAPSYNAAGVELTDEIIKTHIAQKKHEEYVNGAIDANLNEYLWKADNDNRSQALYSVASIVTRDIKLNEAMALQGLNEAAIVNYNKPSADLAIVDMFEETYNDPQGAFSIQGLDDKDIVTLRNGKQVSTKDFNNYVAAKGRRNDQMQSMLKRRSRTWELQDEVGDVEANVKLLEKDYNTWNYSLATLGLGFTDIGTGLLYLGGKAMKYASPVIGTSYWMGQATNAFTDEGNFLTDFWDEWDKEWADQYDDYSLWKEGIKSQYGREVSFHRDKFGRGGAF